MAENQLCTAKIRPFNDNREVVCRLYERHVMRHTGYVSHYNDPRTLTKIDWAENDRRNYRREWKYCDINACIFPKIIEVLMQSNQKD